MAIFKPERIYKIMREKNFPCYIISDGKNEVDAQLNEKLSVTESVSRMAESLGEISGNDVSIEIASCVGANGKMAGRGKMIFERVDLSENSSTVKQIAGVPENGTMIKSLIEKNIELEKKLIEAEAQKKIDALNLRLEALERGDQSGLNGIFNNLIQNEAVQQVLAGWLLNATGMKQPTALAGVSTDVEHAIERLRVIDPDIEVHLFKLATLAETDPDKYFMALKFL